MHVILMLVLITADGKPIQKALERPTLEKCWESARSIMGKMDGAGFPTYSAGCIVTHDPTQESNG